MPVAVWANDHRFGSLATLELVPGPWLCVTASRRFCPFEDEEVQIRCWCRRGFYWIFISGSREHPRTARQKKPRSKERLSQISAREFQGFFQLSCRYGKELATGKMMKNEERRMKNEELRMKN
jgi:hypothetical protein